MNEDAEFWSARFHSCALTAGFIAHAAGRLHDSEYVRLLAYDLCEHGKLSDPNQPTGKPPGWPVDLPSERTPIDTTE